MFSRNVLFGAAAFVAVVVLAFVAVNSFLLWQSDAAVAARLKAIRAAGDPVTRADLAPPKVAPEENAATYLLAAASEFASIRDAAEPIAGTATKLTPEQVAKLHALLDEHTAAFEQLDRACECPQLVWPLVCDKDSQAFLNSQKAAIMKLRGASLVARHRAMVLTAEGKRDEALRGVTKMLRLLNRDRQPTIIGHLSQIACRGLALDAGNTVLQSGPVSADARDAFDAELAKVDAAARLDHALRTERALGLEMIDDMGRRAGWMPRTLFNDATIAYLDQMEGLLGGPKANPSPSDESMISSVNPYRRLAIVLLPVMQAGQAAATRDEANVRCLKLLSAATRMEQEGKPSKTLEDLAGRVTDHDRVDPFDGKPLTFKRLPDGWLIYSVGKNLTDDGGDLQSGHDVGFAPPKAQEVAVTKADGAKTDAAATDNETTSEATTEEANSHP